MEVLLHSGALREIETPARVLAFLLLAVDF